MHQIEKLKLHNVKIIEIIIFKIKNKTYNFEYDLEAFYSSNRLVQSFYFRHLSQLSSTICEYKVFKA